MGSSRDYLTGGSRQGPDSDGCKRGEALRGDLAVAASECHEAWAGNSMAFTIIAPVGSKVEIVARLVTLVSVKHIKLQLDLPVAARETQVGEQACPTRSSNTPVVARSSQAHSNDGTGPSSSKSACSP